MEHPTTCEASKGCERLISFWGVCRITCQCRHAYVCTTKCNTKTCIAEQRWTCWLGQLEKSLLAEHLLLTDNNHMAKSEDTEILFSSCCIIQWDCNKRWQRYSSNIRYSNNLNYQISYYGTALWTDSGDKWLEETFTEQRPQTLRHLYELSHYRQFLYGKNSHSQKHSKIILESKLSKIT